MPSIPTLWLIALVFVCCSAVANAAETSTPGEKSAGKVASAEECLVRTTGVGRVALGMTIAEAMAMYPAAKFVRTSDGDGIALVAMRVENEELMQLFANEQNPDTPIDPARKIVFIETFNPRCRTRDGLYPGLAVASAEQVAGKTVRITRSEIESREYIQFANHPQGITLRIDYSGIFAPGTSATTQYQKGAKLFSLAISLPPEKW